MRNLNVLQPVLNKSAPRKVAGLWRAPEANIATDAGTSVRSGEFSSAIRLWIVVPLLLTLSAGSGTAAETDFDQHVAPIFISHCLECHAGDEPQGGLSLADARLAKQGGDSGEAIIPNHALASLLWKRISADEMPPEHPLKDDEKSTIRRWIDEGAKWGTTPLDPFAITTATRAGRDWWSLQPLKSVAPPLPGSAAWVRNDIDAFVMKHLQKAGLQPSPEADRCTLIRRLYFDLTGLPPTPEQVAEFVADSNLKAYDNIVDELLASPQYGERWARHWLDIVRFGESNGFEYDQPRDNAWHYRNWVIEAFNQDMPYDKFVRLQLAGDILFPGDVNAAAATGFLVAGPHNTTLPDNDAMKMTMAQDELEDLVGIVGQTFLGLTTNCARCHDHKFDPISQKEYYQFAATLTGVTHGERTVSVTLSQEQIQRLAAIEARIPAVQQDLHDLETPVRNAIVAERKSGTASLPDPPEAFAAWEFDGDLNDRLGALHVTAHGSAKVEDGCLVLDGTDAYAATAPLSVDVGEKTLEAWVQLDNLDQRGGGTISLQTNDGAVFDAIVFGEREPKQWMAGSNGFVRTMSFSGADEADADRRFVHIAIVYQADGTITCYRDGQRYGEAYRSGELQIFEAGKSQLIFGLRHSPAGGNRMLSGRLQRAALYNRALTSAEVAASAGVAGLNYVSQADLLARFTAGRRDRHVQLAGELDSLKDEADALKAAQLQSLYTCISADPGITHLLRRGDVSSPAEVVLPSGLIAVAGSSPEFGLSANASDSDRRLRLAEWITHRENPLFARVIVNRLWQYHFGKGIVSTPGDFGFNGGRPSHPELLDWLAARLRASDYRLKDIHRLIVTSSTYRQASTFNARSAQTDADNLLLWRWSPHRLEAEEIRDAVLAATGLLNRQVGGRGYRDVRHFPFKGSNFYESIEETGPETLRRTIYRFTPRGGRNPFLDTFDCPDPSATSPMRASTTTPLQALSLMNNALVFRMADHIAARVEREAGAKTADQIDRVCELVYCRKADPDEIRLASRFVEQYGLASWCRVILNSNEFLYVQ